MDLCLTPGIGHDLANLICFLTKLHSTGCSKLRATRIPLQQLSPATKDSWKQTSEHSKEGEKKNEHVSVLPSKNMAAALKGGQNTVRHHPVLYYQRIVNIKLTRGRKTGQMVKPLMPSYAKTAHSQSLVLINTHPSHIACYECLSFEAALAMLLHYSEAPTACHRHPHFPRTLSVLKASLETLVKLRSGYILHRRIRSIQAADDQWP